jgi:hypothetical protein
VALGSHIIAILWSVGGKKMKSEIVYDVFWDGPYDCVSNEVCGNSNNNVLYQIYGSHHLYGRDVLLYIGRTSREPIKRILEHVKETGCQVYTIDKRSKGTRVSQAA